MEGGDEPLKRKEPVEFSPLSRDFTGSL